MKKLFLLLTFVLTGIAVQAQPDAFNGRGVLFGAGWRGMFTSSHDGVKMRGFEAELLCGYRFTPSFSLLVPGTCTTGLFRAGDAKSYETTGQLGLGVGYSPLHTQSDRLEISARAGSTLGGTWQYLYYDCGLRWQSDVIWKPLSVGVGVRYYDCYGGGFGDYCNFYIEVGVRLLHKCDPHR